MDTDTDTGDELRRSARELAERALARGDAVGWFEELYDAAKRGRATVPWADLAPNPQLVAWFEGRLDLPTPPSRGRALVVGCGFGDDAALLSRRRFEVTAFDVAPTAVEHARARFATAQLHVPITWARADLFDTAESWRGAFDLVVEVNTLQVLPRDLRPRALEAIAAMLAPGGQLFVAARARRADEPEGALPWPLVPRELDHLEHCGLHCCGACDLVDDESPPVRRLVALFTRS